MITIPLQIRPSDQDSLGHVNNAAYVAYVEQAVAEFLARQGFAAEWRDASSPHYWMMDELAVEYRLAASFGDQLAAHVWLAEAHENRPLFGCRVILQVDGQEQEVVRARSQWRRCSASSGAEAQLPSSFLALAGQDGGELPRPFSVQVEERKLRRYHWWHVVERCEVGAGGRAHAHVLFEWIEESILCACDEAGWPISRLLAANFVVYQMRHDASFFSPALLGEAVEVTSRLVNVRHLRGSWHNEIRSRSDGRLLATDYSTGVFLNLEGRPTTPPPGMIEALQEPGP
jgi:acyl-CoA thioester hydrolase